MHLINIESHPLIKAFNFTCNSIPDELSEFCEVFHDKTILFKKRYHFFLQNICSDFSNASTHFYIGCVKGPGEILVQALPRQNIKFHQGKHKPVEAHWRLLSSLHQERTRKGKDRKGQSAKWETCPAPEIRQT